MALSQAITPCVRSCQSPFQLVHHSFRVADRSHSSVLDRIGRLTAPVGARVDYPLPVVIIELHVVAALVGNTACRLERLIAHIAPL